MNAPPDTGVQALEDRMREELEKSEKHGRSARRDLEKARERLEAGPSNEKTAKELQGVKDALASTERVERETGKSHRAREEAHEQREETQRLMRKADREIHETEAMVKKEDHR